MHTQHVKFSTYVLGGDGVGGVVAVGLVFEEGEVSGLVEEDDDRSSVLEVVVVVVFSCRHHPCRWCLFSWSCCAL